MLIIKGLHGGSRCCRVYRDPGKSEAEMYNVDERRAAV